MQLDRPAENARRPVTATCPECGKRRYLTRKNARKAASQLGGGKGHVYRCGGFWHLTSVTANSMALRRMGRR